MSGSELRETVGLLAVVASLVFVGVEIRQNTAADQREAARQRAEVINAPFLSGRELPEILAQIKSVDGPDATPQRFVDRYGLTYAQAAIWNRHLSLVWRNVEADFLASGESSALDGRVRGLLAAPDIQLFLQDDRLGGYDADFVAFVERVRDSSGN